MHRAGVDRAFRNAGCALRGFVEILRRIGFEFREAASRAEIVRSALMLVPVLRCVRVNQHSANGISHALLALGVPMLGLVVACVSFVMMVSGRLRPCMSGTAA